MWQPLRRRYLNGRRFHSGVGARWAGSGCRGSAFEMHGRHCHGGEDSLLGGWPGRMANAAAVRAVRATAAAVVLVGGCAGGAGRVVAAAAVQIAQATLPRWWRGAAERVAWASGSCSGGASRTGKTGNGCLGRFRRRLGGWWLPRAAERDARAPLQRMCRRATGRVAWAGGSCRGVAICTGSSFCSGVSRACSAALVVLAGCWAQGRDRGCAGCTGAADTGVVGGRLCTGRLPQQSCGGVAAVTGGWCGSGGGVDR